MRIALIGHAHAHTAMYCSVWKDMSGVRLAASWDHDPARAEAFAAQWKTKRFEDLDGLLASREIDAVVIGAETAMHAALVEAAASAGKPVVLQKPVSVTLTDAKRIVAAARDVPFTLAWQMRVDPQNFEIKRLIESKAIGTVYMFRRRHGLPAHRFPDFDRSWHVDPTLNRGMWADDASHPIDLVYWLFGMPATVTAEIDTLHSAKIPDDHGIAVFRYANGMFAEVVSSFVCTAMENTTEVVGSQGSIVQNYGDVPSQTIPPDMRGPGLRWFADGSWHDSDVPTPPSHGERIKALAVPLLEFLRGERAPICTAQEGLDSLRMVLASYRAAETGRRVDLDEVK